MKTNHPILLVEDDSIDAMMVQRALQELNVPNQLVHCENGEEALEYLQNDTNIKPCIILLDLNMPRMGGLEFLEVVKKEGRLKLIPIIVLTTSSEQQDLMASFGHSVAGYMVKPIDYQHFVKMMNTISRYWSQSHLPY